jgi:hypothetical protein
MWAFFLAQHTSKRVTQLLPCAVQCGLGNCSLSQCSFLLVYWHYFQGSHTLFFKDSSTRKKFNHWDQVNGESNNIRKLAVNYSSAVLLKCGDALRCWKINLLRLLDRGKLNLIVCLLECDAVYYGWRYQYFGGTWCLHLYSHCSTVVYWNTINSVNCK